MTSNADWFSEGDEMSNYELIRFATFENDRIRGDYSYLILALFVLVIYLIDLKFPKLFFKMQYVLSVSNPEPSSIYLSIQYMMWHVTPVFILLILGVAVAAY